jgi:hypothetical protein
MKQGLDDVAESIVPSVSATFGPPIAIEKFARRLA